MPRLTKSNPKYRRHARGQAVVTLSGDDHYLGPYGTKASYVEYDRLVAEWLANGRCLKKSDDVTIAEMLAAYWRHAKSHYRKDGQPTHELVNIQSAMRPLKALYARQFVSEFGPLKLQAIQQVLIKGFKDSKGKAVKGISRNTVNARIGAIKRMFRWAVSQEMAPPSLAHALETVRGLQRGRTDARETEPVRPVEDAIVETTLPHLSAVVADMIRIQRLTGCRPGEVCSIRPCDIDRTSSPWQYRPATHKMEHHGRDRVIFIGPKAQEVLLPYLLRDSQAYCFSPAESEQQRKAKLREARKTKVQPSQRDRSKARPKRKPTDRYTKDSYNRALRRVCDAHSIPRWSPNQLRHTAATEIRSKFGGVEAAQVVLGHSKASTTEIYAERDRRLAAEIISQIG